MIRRAGVLLGIGLALSQAVAAPQEPPVLVSPKVCLTVSHFYTSLLPTMTQAFKTRRLMFGSQRALDKPEGATNDTVSDE